MSKPADRDAVLASLSPEARAAVLAEASPPAPRSRKPKAKAEPEPRAKALETFKRFLAEMGLSPEAIAKAMTEAEALDPDALPGTTTTAVKVEIGPFVDPTAGKAAVVLAGAILESATSIRRCLVDDRDSLVLGVEIEGQFLGMVQLLGQEDQRRIRPFTRADLSRDQAEAERQSRRGYL